MREGSGAVEEAVGEVACVHALHFAALVLPTVAARVGSSFVVFLLANRPQRPHPVVLPVPKLALVDASVVGGDGSWKLRG